MRGSPQYAPVKVRQIREDADRALLGSETVDAGHVSDAYRNDQAARTSSGSLVTVTIVHGLRCSTCSSSATTMSR
ncbi:MAG: hypothetical protein JWR85_3737 [Marmoricola sp.]|nr:hypothetical protein [Marmoricola sp.]